MNNNNNSNNNNNNQSQEEVLKKKVTLLIKGLKEEKQTTSKLKEEIEVLKYDLEEKKLLLKKTKEEYQELVQSKISPEKLSTYFNLLENQENIETPDKEKYKLKKENKEFEKRINILEEEKRNLLQKLEKAEKAKEEEILSLNSQITSLKNQLSSYKDSILESQEKSSKLLNNIKYEKLVSNDKEAKIAKLQSDNENLISDNNKLKQQNGYFMQIIEQLKNQIENKGKEFFYLEKEIDDNKEIKLNEYIFKGYINKISKWLVSDWNQIRKNVTIFFGKKVFNLTFDLNGKSIDVNIDDILTIEYYKENKKKIKIKVDGEGKESIKKALNFNNKRNKKNEDESIEAVLVCSFTERECKYIIKFYRDIKVKYEKECGGFINSSMTVGFFD